MSLKQRSLIRLATPQKIAMIEFLNDLPYLQAETSPRSRICCEVRSPPTGQPYLVCDIMLDDGIFVRSVRSAGTILRAIPRTQRISIHPNHASFDRLGDRNFCGKNMANTRKPRHNRCCPNWARFSIHLPSGLHDRLMAACSETGLQKSSIMRAALSEYLDNLAQKEPRRSI